MLYDYYFESLDYYLFKTHISSQNQKNQRLGSEIAALKNALLAAHSDAGKIKECQNIINDITYYATNVHFYFLCKAYIHSNQPKLGLKFLKKFENFEREIDTNNNSNNNDKKLKKTKMDEDLKAFKANESKYLNFQQNLDYNYLTIKAYLYHLQIENEITKIKNKNKNKNNNIDIENNPKIKKLKEKMKQDILKTIKKFNIKTDKIDTLLKMTHLHDFNSTDSNDF